jgi:cytochrome b
MQNSKKPFKISNINKVNLFFDVLIFVTFLITTAPHLSGIPIHEWLSLALAVAIIVHLLLHWGWVVETIRRTFKALPRTTRINSILNTALFIDFVIITFTGIAISEAALPLFGIHVTPNFTWRRLHDQASNIGLVLLGLHIGMHWDWIVNSVKRYIIAPLTGGKSAATPSTQPEAEVQP